MKVLDICKLTTTDTKIIVKGNGKSRGLKYEVPKFIKDSNPCVMDMEVGCIEVEFGVLVLHVGVNVR